MTPGYLLLVNSIAHLMLALSVYYIVATLSDCFEIDYLKTWGPYLLATVSITYSTKEELPVSSGIFHSSLW